MGYRSLATSLTLLSLLPAGVQLGMICGFAHAQSAPAAAPTAAEKTEALGKGVDLLLNLQEGDNKSEWPYEGVYRVEGKIPIGYRVGGTAICAMALLEAPGYDADAARKEAVGRAVAFICAAKDNPLMSVAGYEGGYDVRAWGYIYALRCLCRLHTLGAVPPDHREAAAGALQFYLSALGALEMPITGGWNYARPPGRESKGSPSSFMTAAALQALFEAVQAGHAVDARVLGRGLDFLEKTKAASGAVMYAGEAKHDSDARLSNAVPGATGRMTATEATLLLGGRGSVAEVRASIDAFIVHWEWLEQRRAQPGTHKAPYSVAPYYFMFAHFSAAQAVELLPEVQRAEYRRRVNELLFSVRQEDGSWNDRVFERSSAYSTAMAMLAIMSPDAAPPARWTPPPPPPATPLDAPGG